MEFFRPVEIKEYYINRIASGMSRYFYNNIFAPIFKILDGNSVINTKEALINALKSGKIFYKNGAFRTSGSFSNEMSRTLESFGAKFRNGAYYIEQSLIPMEYAQAISIAQAQTAAKLLLVKQFLDSYVFTADDLNKVIEPAAKEMFKSLEIDIIKSAQEKNVPVIELGLVNPKPQNVDKAKIKEIQDYWKNVDKQIKDLNDKKKNAEKQEKAQKDKKNKDGGGNNPPADDKGGKDSTPPPKDDNKGNNPPAETSADLSAKINEINKNAFENAPKIEINDTALDEQSKKIAEDYTYNMRYWVKKWEAKNIIKMREDVLDMVQKGKRLPEIQEYFQERWGRAKDKAFFLAKNESHIAGSVITKNQYQKIGCTQFKWGRSNSKEKRELHKTYYNKIFDFNNPPIIDERTGQTGLPRQTYNCLCHMFIVVPDVKTQLARRQEVKNSKTLINRLKNAVSNNKQFSNNAWQYRRFDERQTV